MLFSHRKFDYHRVILAFEFNHMIGYLKLREKSLFLCMGSDMFIIQINLIAENSDSRRIQSSPHQAQDQEVRKALLF